MGESRKYDAASALCMLHAAFLSVSISICMVFSPAILFSRFVVELWWILFLIWPSWLFILFVLAFLAGRKLRRIFIPIGVGIFVLIPAVFFVLVIWSFGHPSGC